MKLGKVSFLQKKKAERRAAVGDASALTPFKRLPLNIQDIKKVRLLRKDPFGSVLLFKRMLITAFAFTTYGKFNIVNSLKVEGTEHLMDLPPNNVLFVSNHQTYYADVMALYHVFSSVKWRFHNSIRLPLYAFMPRVKLYYIAAEETMKQSGLMPKIFAYTGAVTVKRSWRAAGQDVQRNADLKAPVKIKKALESGWVVNFPQGTTSPYAPVRKGTANLVKAFNPIVVPVVIDGFRRAFDKRGLFYKKRGTQLHVRFKAPLQYDDDTPVEQIVEMIRKAIEQDRPARD